MAGMMPSHWLNSSGGGSSNLLPPARNDGSRLGSSLSSTSSPFVPAASVRSVWNRLGRYVRRRTATEPLEPLDSSSFNKALTISLGVREDLRGISPHTLLQGCGQYLRGSSGGIGCGADEKADEDYAKSFPIDELDTFLSHSWHAPWVWKFLSLLVYYNFTCALVAYLVVLFFGAFILRSTASITCEAGGMDEGLMFWSVMVNHTGNWCFTSRFWLHILCSGAFVYTTFSAHTWRFGNNGAMDTSVSFASDIISRRQTGSIFLDKLCIHQTDRVKKLRGIKSIGAFLARTRTMLVVWDGTYFERLWCAFELVAFTHARPDGDIKVLPIQLGPFMLAMAAMELFSTIYQDPLRRCTDWGVLLPMVANTTCTSLAIPFVRKYMRERRQLAEWIPSYSVRATSCFCCDNQHVHPDTGASLPCDREVVYATIKNWSPGKDTDTALDAFDARIRHTLLLQTNQPRAGIPYFFACAMGMLSIGIKASFVVMYEEKGDCACSFAGVRFHSALALLCDVVVHYPAAFAVMCYLADTFSAHSATRLGSCLVNYAIAASASSTYWAVRSVHHRIGVVGHGWGEAAHEASAVIFRVCFACLLAFPLRWVFTHMKHADLLEEQGTRRLSKRNSMFVSSGNRSSTPKSRSEDQQTGISMVTSKLKTVTSKLKTSKGDGVKEAGLCTNAAKAPPRKVKVKFSDIVS